MKENADALFQQEQPSFNASRKPSLGAHRHFWRAGVTQHSPGLAACRQGGRHRVERAHRFHAKPEESRSVQVQGCAPRKGSGRSLTQGQGLQYNFRVVGRRGENGTAYAYRPRPSSPSPQSRQRCPDAWYLAGGGRRNWPQTSLGAGIGYRSRKNPASVLIRGWRTEYAASEHL